MRETAFLNGDYVPLEEARVSVEDRGFLFGDGVYEVIRCYAGQPFRMMEHLERLQASAAAIALALPLTTGEMIQVCDTLLGRSGLTECTIYFEATRGAAPRAHAFPPSAVPTVLAYACALSPLSPASRAAGVPLISVPDDRWGRCHIKSINLLPNVLAKQKAVEAGAYEGLFVRENDDVTEGTASNAFAVLDGRIYTHPADNRILHGVTRAAVIEVARSRGLEVREEALGLASFIRADEVFLSGTSIEIIGVSSIDAKPIGAGTPGPVTRGIYEGFVSLTRV